MRKLFYLVAASLMLSSCLENKVIEEYNEDFENVFGATDPNHTWKMVENKEVEVSLDKPSRVKIYVNSGDNTYRLAADYENVTGTQSLSYDAPMGCEDIHVTVDGIPYQKGNSRSEGQVSESPVTLTNDFKVFTYAQVDALHQGGDRLPETKDNSEKVHPGCRIISNGETFKFYPIYWGGIFNHEYGLYYYKNGERIETPIFFKNKKDDSLKYKDENGSWLNVDVDYVYQLFFPEEGVAPSYEPGEDVLKSRCFEIELDANTEFGFYVDIYNGDARRGRFYSDPELNKFDQTNVPFAAFAYLHVEGDPTTYITIEDYDDNDYNDFIFMIEGSHSHVEENPIKYIYAVEDLGGTNDFDFNDVVFSVSHVKGKENATVQPLAAGGIYPVQICFNGTPYGYNGREVHAMLGVESNVMVNTKAGTTKENMKKADPFLVPVGANWSHAETKFTNECFSVHVKLPGKDKVISSYGHNESDAAPQMLVLSENWLWPTETTRISEAYPEFGEYGANHTNATWVSNFINDLVVNWK